MFLCVVADRDHMVEINVIILIDIVGSMPGNIDPSFLHDGNSFWVDTVGLDASTVNYHPVARKKSKVTFGDLAPAAVPGAEYQYFFAPVCVMYYVPHLLKKQPNEVDDAEFRIPAKNQLQYDN
jgi:hypothetical protein